MSLPARRLSAVRDAVRDAVLEISTGVLMPLVLETPPIAKGFSYLFHRCSEMLVQLPRCQAGGAIAGILYAVCCMLILVVLSAAILSSLFLKWK